MTYSCRKFNTNAEETYQAFKRRLIEEGFHASPTTHDQISRSDSYDIELPDTRRKPLPGEKWFHNGNRHFYEVILISNEDSIKTKFIPTVVYRSIDHDKIWSSPICRFLKRFTHEDDLAC